MDVPFPGVYVTRDPNPELPRTVTHLTTPAGSDVYIVGTAHFSQSSQEDVAKVRCRRLSCAVCWGIPKVTVILPLLIKEKSHICCLFFFFLFSFYFILFFFFFWLTAFSNLRVLVDIIFPFPEQKLEACQNKKGNSDKIFHVLLPVHVFLFLLLHSDITRLQHRFRLFLGRARLEAGMASESHVCVVVSVSVSL